MDGPPRQKIGPAEWAGRSVEIADAAGREAAIEAAFAFRGDVRLHTADGRVVEGYLFDRRPDGPDAHVRLMPSDGGERVALPYAIIRRVEFHERDPAAGHNWETWVAAYARRKARGEPANIDPEPLE